MSAVMYDIERSRFEDCAGNYTRWLEDQCRIMQGLPALHARFLGPTRRKHYPRRERRRRRWL